MVHKYGGSSICIWYILCVRQRALTNFLENVQ